MSIPAWADAEYSKQLPNIRAGGEGQHAEFIVDFSDEPREVAKEVAAFATSGGGKILLGVRNDGTVAGLNAEDHDKILHRVQGIVRTVQPTAASTLYLCYDDGFILVIDVSQEQDEPLYYVEQRPYVRDIRESRPAKPQEVKERVWSHPSSSYKKRMEDLNYEIARSHVEQTTKRIAAEDEITQRAMAAQHETLAAAGRRFLEGR